MSNRPTKKQIDALNMLFDYVENLTVCFKDTSLMINLLNESGIEANDFIVEKYPFKQSFDDLIIEVSAWKESVQEKIGLKTYEPETDPINPSYSDIEKLSKAFSYAIRQELSKEDLYTVVKTNAKTNDNTCATHDFCDANMVMYWSFGYAFQEELETDSEVHTNLVNAAWSMSKKANFEN